MIAGGTHYTQQSMVGTATRGGKHVAAVTCAVAVYPRFFTAKNQKKIASPTQTCQPLALASQPFILFWSESKFSSSPAHTVSLELIANTTATVSAAQFLLTIFADRATRNV